MRIFNNSEIVANEPNNTIEAINENVEISNEVDGE